eukprot:3087039-Ditylum_brightwellii.AAC.1
MDGDPSHGHPLPGNFPLHAGDSDSVHSGPFPTLLSCRDSSLSEDDNDFSLPPEPPRQSPPMDSVSIRLSIIPSKTEIKQYHL